MGNDRKNEWNNYISHYDFSRRYFLFYHVYHNRKYPESMANAEYVNIRNSEFYSSNVIIEVSNQSQPIRCIRKVLTSPRINFAAT